MPSWLEQLTSEHMLLEEDLCRVVVDTWRYMLTLDVQPASATNVPKTNEQTFTGVVHILGDWCGAVAVECRPTLARQVTQHIYDIGEQDLKDEMIADAFREIANVTGGNLKPLLGTRCILSVPKASLTRGFDYSVPGCVLVMRLAFELKGEPFQVSVFESHVDLEARKEI